MTLSSFHALIALSAITGVGCISYEDSAAVFDRTKLHTVDITVDPSDRASLETDLTTRVPCTLSYDGEVVEEAGIRQKGGKPRLLSDRPSFSVKIDDFDSAAKLHGLTRIILNNSEQDTTLLREQIGADMYARAGMPAARIAHAVVSLDGVDKGIYIVVEAITKDFLADRFGGDGDGNLYEGPCCGDFVDNIDFPELDDEVDDGRSRDDLAALADIIKNTPDDALAAELDEHLDLGKLITSYALDAALGNWDGFFYRANNYYMYNNPEDERFVFMPHGMDQILTMPDDITEGKVIAMPSALFDPETAPIALLPGRIRAIPALSERFHNELARVVADVWNEDAVLAAIDQTATQIQAASGGATTTTNVSIFNLRLEGLRSLVKERRAFVAP